MKKAPLPAQMRLRIHFAMNRSGFSMMKTVARGNFSHVASSRALSSLLLLDLIRGCRVH
ncbi:hypothetical protein FB480_103240 [Agrobacterium vitis]|nr:hypothetical protein FB480_103240 [Agrobacterium vitis]